MKKTRGIILILFCFIGCPSGCLSCDPPKVRVDSGEIAGGYEYTYNGRKLYSFLGIPYANPPEPQSVEPWLGVWNATIPGSACPGPDYKTNAFEIKGQEDCLYLNVYTPKLPEGIESDNDLMNVVVYIHGGAFVGGEGVTYGPQYLLDNNDFVYVSINYRLGVLGFVATGDNVLPGNNGMKDQVAALRWIQRNVRAFGGNPNEVTVTGKSAGASSVHYHLVSPMSKNLFNRAILLSGSAYCHWSYTENVAEKTKYVANELGCPTSDSADIIKCLRSRPAKIIAESIKHLMPWRFNPFSPFGPTVEPANGKERFLPDIPEKLVARDIPLLMSVTRDEGLGQAEYILFTDAVHELNNNWNEYIPHLLDYNYTILNASLSTKIARDIRGFYFGDKTVSSETKSDLVKMISDRMFGYAASKAAETIASKNTAPVYFHEFGYSGEYSYVTDIHPDSYTPGSGVTHGDETIYILKNVDKHPHDNEKDTKMIEIMVNIWASFIKNGVPDLGNTTTTWLPVSKNPTDPFRYIKITQNQTFESKEQRNHGNYSFWSSLPLTEFHETNMARDITHAEL